MVKRWHTATQDEAAAAALAAETGYPLPACAVWVARGFGTPDAVDAYLNPRLSALGDPLALPDMDLAVGRLLRALDLKESILVYGDYDVDGITSTALMVRVLSALGARAIPFLPHRVDDGYGLGVDPVERCIKEHAPSCIITVDCGTQSKEAVAAARALGVDVIVTDHHEPGPEIAPAVAVVNPKRASEGASRDLAGVGVAFKLCHALLKRLRDQGHPAAGLDLRAYLDLVALGTVADMVPLRGENRALARYGLNEMNRTAHVGLAALKEVAGIRDAVSAYHVGFLLGPRLNAAGRLDSASTALELLLTTDSNRAHALAVELDAANRERQQVEARMVEEAMAEIDTWFRPDRHLGIVAARRGWHPGVVGIVASRLCARYQRPSVVVAIDEDGIGRGSCRSIGPFHMVEGLSFCADLLLRYGGHAMAAGLQIDEKKIDTFRERFDAAVGERVTREDLIPEQRVDAWLSLRDANENLMQCLDRMAPFGLGNTQPVWAVRGARLVGAPRIVGEKHWKMTVLEGNARLDAIAFGMANRILPDGPVDFAFQLQRNSFRGRETLQMVVQDFRPADLR